MNFFEALVANPYINASILAWFIAQLIKVILVCVFDRKIDFSRFIGAGGMPSSHASTVCALAVIVGRGVGFTTPEFAIALIFAIVVMYDAAGVRRAAGQQAAVLNRMLETWQKGDNTLMETQLKELLGHTPMQVFFGALLGGVIGWFYPL